MGWSDFTDKVKKSIKDNSLLRQAHQKYKSDYDRFSGKNAAKKAEKEQKKTDEMLQAQTSQEKLKLQESEDEINRRKLLRTAGGRGSLLSRTLGG